MAFIEQAEVIDLPVPGTCLRLPLAFATQTGAATHRQAADRKDPHPPRAMHRPSVYLAGTIPRRVISWPWLRGGWLLGAAFPYTSDSPWTRSGSPHSRTSPLAAVSRTPDTPSRFRSTPP